MEVKALSWVGVKTERFVEMAAFFTDVLGLRVELDEPDFLVCQLPSGDSAEVFGPGADDPPQQFATNKVVCGFLVGDLQAAKAELVAAGIELLGPTETGDGGYAWQHFRARDGTVFELISDPRRP